MRSLGRGGFGNVYEAHDPLLERKVALKVPRLSDREDGEELFLHEARAAARLRHPNIVAVFESGIADGQPYIASELVDGTSLSKMLHAGPMPVREVIRTVREISEAIDYAHSEGIIHRDLKPDNIMMSRAGRAQVMDFGLARLGSDATKSLMAEGSIVGTPAYMSPEQARGDKDAVGPKSDQYSVGVLLYLMLCGRLPYQGESWSVISSVANPDVQPKAPRAFRGDIPRDLEACCLKAMEKDPRRRYESLAALADDLNRWLEGRPLLARPVSLGEQFFRWCGRNRAVASLLALIASMIFAALVIGYVLAFQFSNLADYANRRADAEQQAKREAEQLLIDTFTESGLDAGAGGNDQEALLWFGNAVARAAEYPRRERMNRARFRAWLRQAPIPVRIFDGQGHWFKSLVVHPSGQFVLAEHRRPGVDYCRIWTVATGQPWSLPWDAEPITVAAWNDQGDVLALASGEQVRTFRFPDGEQLDQWKHSDHPHVLRFSDDGNKLAVVGRASIMIRDLTEAKSDRVISTPSYPERVAWNPSGTTLAALCGNRQVYIWKFDAAAATEPLLPAIACPFGSDPPKLHFIDNNLLVVPESGEAVRCWDVSSGDVVWSVPCTSHAFCVVAPDRSRIAIISKLGVTQVKASDGESLGPPIRHENVVYDAMYDPTGTLLLTGCADHFARVFSADNGELISSMRHGDMVHRVAWFPGGQACATVHWKADLLRVWKLGVGRQPGFVQPLYGRVMHVKWNGDGSRFLPCGVDIWRSRGAPAVRNTIDGSAEGPVIEFPGRASDGCLVPGTPHVLYAGSDADAQQRNTDDRLSRQDLSRPGLIVSANIETGKAVFPPIQTDSNVVAIESSPDGRIVAALCHDHQLLMIDPVEGTVLHRHETFPGINFMYGFVIIRRLAFSPSGDRFAVWGSQSSTIEMRDAKDGSLIFTTSHSDGSDSNFLHNVVFSPDGAKYASCSSDQTVRVFSAEDGELLSQPLLHSGWVFSASFSRDGQRLLTACQDRQARLWKLNDVNKPILVTPAQNDEVYATCFLPGEEVFLIGLRNGEVSAWDAQQGKMITPGVAHSDQPVIYSLALSPDQSRVIVVGRESVVRGFPTSRWQPSDQHWLSRDELRLLGEIISAQELYGGVLMGLSGESILARWEQLYQQHSNDEIFRWTTGK